MPLHPINLEDLVRQALLDESLSTNDEYERAVAKTVADSVGRPLTEFELGRIGLEVGCQVNARGEQAVVS